MNATALIEPEAASLDPAKLLTQAEVERLLAEVAEEERSAASRPAGAGGELPAAAGAQPYDFRHPVLLSASEMRSLRQRHDEFVRALAARLSIYLRLEFTLQVSKLQTLTYQQFVEGLSNPTHLTLFKVEPLRGVCLLDINPRLGLTIVDRLMGGPAHSVSSDHETSEIELALLNQAVQLIVAEWCNHWVPLQDLRAVILGHETSGRFLQTAPPDTVMLLLSMEARLGDCMEEIQFGFPYATLEPLIRRLSRDHEAQSQDVQPAAAARRQWNPQFNEVKIPITAQWAGLEMSARELTRLKVGDVLQFDPQCVNQVLVQLAGLAKFTGRLGSAGNQRAVELTQVLPG